MENENPSKTLKYDEADSHFEAENLNKYDCLDLKDKNLVITAYETEYVDPEDGKVKDVKNNPNVDFSEVIERDPNEIFNQDLLKDLPEK